MYYLCKFSGTWSIYDKTSGKSSLLAESDILLFKTMFPSSLRSNAILDAIMIAPLPAGKLQQQKITVLPGAYYILKFSGTWIMYECTRKNERSLLPPEIDLLKTSFPGSLHSSALLDTLIITPISASRLQQLTFDEPSSNDGARESAARSVKGP